jgi:hypothetical protein
MKGGQSYAGTTVRDVRELLSEVMNTNQNSMDDRREAVQKLEQCKELIDSLQTHIMQFTEHLPAPHDD